MKARSGHGPGNRCVGVFIVFAEPLFEQIAILSGQRKLGSGVGFFHDAVPQLLHEREPCLEIERKEKSERRARP